MTFDYGTIRLVHAGTAGVSLALFVLRAAWMLTSPARLQRRWVKILPHVIDTLLLASALWLAWHLAADGVPAWLAAKVVALVVYIALGTLALKRGRTRGARIAAFVAAIATFGYIAAVAVTKSPLAFVAWL